MILIKDIGSRESGRARRLACKVLHQSLPEALYFECESDLALAGQDSSADGFLLGLLWPAMVLGEDLHIEGPVSEELLYAANNALQALLMSHDPSLKRIAISARSALPPAGPREQVVATGFSGGIDTFATLKLYADMRVPGFAGVDILTTFNVGALGNTQEAAALFERYSKRTRKFAQETSRSWVNVNSNLDDFYRLPNCGFQKTHTIRNIAAAYSIKDLITDYLYSSSYPFSCINLRRSDMGFLDPILLPLASIRSLRLHSAGAQFSRLEKTMLVSDYEPAFELLDVCAGPPEERASGKHVNCGGCRKCAVTLIALDALGRLEKFTAAFDVDKFRRNEPQAYAMVLSGALEGGISYRDLLNFLRQQGLPSRITKDLLIKSYAMHYLRMMRCTARASLGRMRRR